MKNINTGVEDILFSEVDSDSTFDKFRNEKQETIKGFRTYETHLVKSNNYRNFKLQCFCIVCSKKSNFQVAGVNRNDELPVNWRETLICPDCGLNNRLRATVHFLNQFTPALLHGSKTYISEQTTPLYHYLIKTKSDLFGSEYLGEKIPFGSVDRKGIRNESATKLTFEDNSLDAYLSFDVFEHIPDYENAFTEAFRVLKKQGQLIFTVPFAVNDYKNIIRAVINQKGEIEHILPPEYHGDPLSSEGTLCFQVYGWEILDRVRSIGFDQAAAYIYLSAEYGYLGDIPLIFRIIK